MKKELLLFALSFVLISVQAQDYRIGFSGTGTASSVESVVVENLTQDTSITMNGGDILHLVKTVGIGSPGNPAVKVISVFPNPCSSGCRLSISLPEATEISIGISDMAGRELIRFNRTQVQMTESYEIKGLNTGTYAVTLETKNGRFAEKLICSSPSTGPMVLNHLGGQAAQMPMNNQGIVQMQYNDGDQLLFKCFSGDFTTVVPLVATQNTIIQALFANCADGSGNHYPVVQIGGQLWMEENLKTTSDNYGNLIPEVTDDVSWGALTSPGMCWYNNDPQGPYTYGALYNGFAARSSGICPSDWHVPSEEEFTALINFLGGTNEAGKKLKESGIEHWLYSIHTTATNEYGFTALPAGYRHTGGHFVNVSLSGYWWGSTPTSEFAAWSISMGYNSPVLSNFDDDLHAGKSIRCIHD
jgi:uncharacterized protein (TIGR02145 family)